MSREKKFVIGVNNGMEIDLESGCEDMPEEVRAYVDEVLRQLEEEGEDGTFTIDDRNIPPEVDAYFRKKVEEKIEAGRTDINTVKVAEYPPDGFEKILDTIVRADEVETTMKKLLDEIEKTKRRVNALEFKIIPELKESERFVKFSLEEMERENTTRLKHLKKE